MTIEGGLRWEPDSMPSQLMKMAKEFNVHSLLYPNIRRDVYWPQLRDREIWKEMRKVNVIEPDTYRRGVKITSPKCVFVSLFVQ